MKASCLMVCAPIDLGEVALVPQRLQRRQTVCRHHLHSQAVYRDYETSQFNGKTSSTVQHASVFRMTGRQVPSITCAQSSPGCRHPHPLNPCDTLTQPQSRDMLHLGTASLTMPKHGDCFSVRLFRNI